MFKVFKNDKVTLIKDMGKLKKIGEVFEVANITDTSIVIRDMKTKIALAAIPINEFDEFFSKDEIPKWTNWIAIRDVNDSIIAFYRTNGKKVQVKIKWYRCEASCNTMDDFDLYFGIQLAYLRCKNKALKAEQKIYRDEIKEIDSQIKSNKTLINQMIMKYYPTDNEDEKGE